MAPRSSTEANLAAPGSHGVETMGKPRVGGLLLSVPSVTSCFIPPALPPPPRVSRQLFPPFSSVWGGDRWPLHEYESALDAFYRRERSKRRRNLCFLSFLLFNPSPRRTNFAQLRLPGFCTETSS